MTPETLTPAAAIYFGGWALSIFGYGYWYLSDMENQRRKRVLMCALVLVCLLIASPIALVANEGQPVPNTCDSCANVESWALWIFLGCWSCP